MLINVTRRSLTISTLFLGATVAAACSGRNGLKGSGRVDAGHDLSAVLVRGPDTLPITDLASTDPDLPASTCGNGHLDPGELCDDGNTFSGDGCSRLCQIESDWPPGCLQPPCRVVVCGDGRLDSSETCDDRNITSGDGCSADCKSVEDGWRCPWIGQRCIPICGDRQRKGSENCDDGNTVSGDGCSSTCLTEPGWDCLSGSCVPSSGGDGGQALDGGYLYCGDGIMSGAEECDDGPENSDAPNYGCTTQCRRTYCGDGVVNGPEECDLGAGNTASYGDVGGCTSGCTRAHYCGDGVVDSTDGENCDLGAENGTLGTNCGLNCQLWGLY